MSSSPLQQKIETIIRDDGLKTRHPLELSLRGLSSVYKQAAVLKNRLVEKGLLRQYRLPCPVVSVGNIAVGGTGKTPMVMYLADALSKIGIRPVILSRGYGGTASKVGGMVSDGETIKMTAEEAGDEPWMMAGACTGVPVFVGRNRYEIGLAALRTFDPDLIVLDDGFQHRKLHRDLDLVLLDANRPLGNGFLLPRGPLREPAQALKRAGLFVLTRADKAQQPVAAFRKQMVELGLGDVLSETPALTCSHRPYVYGIQKAGINVIERTPDPSFPDKVFGFSGIARNEDFEHSVTALGFETKGFRAYPDHHPYSPEDLDTVVAEAGRRGATALITTEKDAVRLDPEKNLPMDLWIVGIRMTVESGEDLLLSRIRNVL